MKPTTLWMVHLFLGVYLWMWCKISEFLVKEFFGSKSGRHNKLCLISSPKIKTLPAQGFEPGLPVWQSGILSTGPPELVTEKSENLSTYLAKMQNGPFLEDITNFYFLFLLDLKFTDFRSLLWFNENEKNCNDEMCICLQYSCLFARILPKTHAHLSACVRK